MTTGAQAKPGTNPLLDQALDLAFKMAGAKGGNAGVWQVLGTLLRAYREGKVMLLARHVETWCNETATDELEPLRRAA